AWLRQIVAEATSATMDRRLRIGITEREPLRRQRSLHHGPGIADVEGKRRVRAASRVTTDGTALAVIVESPWMLRIDQARVLVLDQLLHDGEHIVFTFVDEDFGVALVGLLHLHVAEMHVIDAIAGGEVSADLDRIVAHLARDAAIEGDAVRGTL